MTISTHRAEQLVVEAVLLVDRLPAVLDAVSSGGMSWEHARVAVDLLGGLSAALRDRAQDELLAKADGRTPQQWRAIVRRWVMRADADAISRRVAEAVRARTVTVYAGADGMGTLSARLPLPVARAVEDALRRYARAAATPDDARSAGERMADCLVSLVLDPGGHGMSPVQAHLTVVAAVQTLLGGDEPGEVAGDVVPAAMVRDLARALGLLPDEPPASSPDRSSADSERVPASSSDQRPASGSDRSSVSDSDRVPASSSDQPPPGNPDGLPGNTADPSSASGGGEPLVTARGRGSRHEGAVVDEAFGSEADRLALGALLSTRTTAVTGLAGIPRIAVADATTGALVALTDAAGIRRALRNGVGLGPPPPTDGYRPSAPLDAFVRLRDRRCQFPGCRVRAGTCDVDHQRPYLRGGTTTACNLACLCVHHHRLSHQAPGWRLRRTPDGGGLTWTTPTGQTITTRPSPLDPTSTRDCVTLDDRQVSSGAAVRSTTAGSPATENRETGPGPGRAAVERGTGPDGPRRSSGRDAIRQFIRPDTRGTDLDTDPAPF